MIISGNADEVFPVARSYRSHEKPKRGEVWPVNEAIIALHQTECPCAATYRQVIQPIAFVIAMEPTVLAIADLQSFEGAERDRLENIVWEDTRDGALRSFSFDVTVAVSVSNNLRQHDRWYRGTVMFVNQSVASVEVSHLFVHQAASVPASCGTWITLPAPTTLAELFETKPWLPSAP